MTFAFAYAYAVPSGTILWYPLVFSVQDRVVNVIRVRLLVADVGEVVKYTA